MEPEFTVVPIIRVLQAVKEYEGLKHEKESRWRHTQTFETGTDLVWFVFSPLPLSPQDRTNYFQLESFSVKIIIIKKTMTHSYTSANQHMLHAAIC